MRLGTSEYAKCLKSEVEIYVCVCVCIFSWIVHHTIKQLLSSKGG